MKYKTAFTLMRNGAPFSDITVIPVDTDAEENHCQFKPGGHGELLNSTTWAMLRLNLVRTYGPRSEWLQALVTITLDAMLIVNYRPVTWFVGAPDEFGSMLIDTPGMKWYPDYRSERVHDMWGLHVRNQGVSK